MDLSKMTLRELRILNTEIAKELYSRFGSVSDNDLKADYAKIAIELRASQKRLINAQN